MGPGSADEVERETGRHAGGLAVMLLALQDRAWGPFPFVQHTP